MTAFSGEAVLPSGFGVKSIEFNRSHPSIFKDATSCWSSKINCSGKTTLRVDFTAFTKLVS